MKTKEVKDQKERDQKAKEQVENLLKDITIPNKDKDKLVNRVSKLNKDKEKEYLEGEMERLTEENEELRKKLVDKINTTPVASAPAQQSNSLLLNKVKIFFKETEDLYLGRNTRNTKIENVPTKQILDRLLFHFGSELKNK